MQQEHPDHPEHPAKPVDPPADAPGQKPVHPDEGGTGDPPPPPKH